MSDWELIGTPECPLLFRKTLFGGYDDITPKGKIDRVRAGSIRFRRAEHAHVTMAGPKGARTIVLMGPLRRPWGKQIDDLYRRRG